MKKMLTIHKTSVALLLTVLALVGCADIELDETPPGLLSPTNFYTTEADFEAALAGTFRALYSNYNGFDYAYPLGLSSGAEDVSMVVTRDFHHIDQFIENGSQDGIVIMWASLYQCIANANTLIGNLGNAQGISPERLGEIEGQAKFIRALSYFYLVRWFGEVQLTTLENQKDIATLKQSSVEEIYASIINNLKDAEEKLPLSFSDRGRPTMGAAKALLAKVYLTMAGWPLEDTSKYADARDKAAEVMSLSYGLEPKFLDLWTQENKLTNSEFIFGFYGSNESQGLSGSHLHVASRASVGGEGGWGDFFSEERFFNVFPAGPRKDASFTTNFADGSDYISAGVQPFIAKYRDAGESFDNLNGEGFFVVLRYADVLLMYAEAANMAENSPSSAALEAVNKVRRRAMNLDLNTPDVSVDLPSTISQQDFEEAVIAERNWELAFECNRWFDLVRKKMVVEVNQSLYPNVSVTNRLLPKPSAQLIPGILDQNTGY